MIINFPATMLDIVSFPLAHRLVMNYLLTLQTLEDVAVLFVVKLTFLQLLPQTDAFI